MSRSNFETKTNTYAPGHFRACACLLKKYAKSKQICRKFAKLCPPPPLELEFCHCKESPLALTNFFHISVMSTKQSSSPGCQRCKTLSTTIVGSLIAGFVFPGFDGRFTMRGKLRYVIKAKCYFHIYSYNCSVKLEQGSTPFFKSQIGVKQGCNLSPTLFNLFINDLPDIFNRSCTPVTLNDNELSCLLYADDLVLLSESKAGLQNCLTKLDSYTKKWKLNINFKKSKVMAFGTPTQNRLHSTSVWSINQNTLENVNEYCYLGITLHSSGNFKRAQKIIHGKALQAYHSIFKSFSNVENILLLKLMLKLFSSIDTPIILYGCEVWGPYLLGRIKFYASMVKWKNFI